VATAGIQLNLELENLRSLREALGRLFPPDEKARVLEAALKKALTPAYERLVQLTPVGPTGNLKRAAGTRTKAYTRSGNAVALIGYRRAGSRGSRSSAGGKVRLGKDRAFHQWWLEEGTDDRVVSSFATKPYARRGHVRRTAAGEWTTVKPHQVKRGQQGYIASSYAQLGPFRFRRTSKETGRVQTDPAYPQAFFKKSASPIRLAGVTPGGVLGRPPLATAWQQSRSTVATILSQELRLTLEQAVSTLVRSASGTL
jgi:hypothetical protein